MSGEDIFAAEQVARNLDEQDIDESIDEMMIEGEKELEDLLNNF
jgi:hypothetical protein